MPKITDISKALADPNIGSSQTTYFNNLVEKLRAQPSKDCPPGNNPEHIEQTYDGMIINLLERVTQDAKEKLKSLSLPESEKEQRLGQILQEEMIMHVKQLGEMIEKDRAELESEKQEQKKKITSDDIKEGWETKVGRAKICQ